MKSARLKPIIGKTIESIVFSQRNDMSPSEQIFLVFSDGTYFEIYGNLGCAGGLDSGGVYAAIKYAEKGGGKLSIYTENSE